MWPVMSCNKQLPSWMCLRHKRSAWCRVRSDEKSTIGSIRLGVGEKMPDERQRRKSYDNDVY